MILRSVVFGQMGNVVDLFVVYCYFGTLLDRIILVPPLPIRAQSRSARADAHQPFTPLLLGTKQIANFRESSYPELGAYLLCFSVLLIVLAGWFSRKETTCVKNRHFDLLLALCLA